jgi:L-ascorbate metabolism protein UlaG (beta-lactamase superfamily)
MVIKWLGHACFSVTLGSGIKVLFDPYDGSVGYPVIDLETDIVITSHSHFDHSDLSGIKGSFAHIKTAGVHSLKDIVIEGIPTWHDHHQGAHRGENLVFTLKSDGMTLCHTGDLGCMPSDDVFEKLKGVDILLINVGGNYVINASEAVEICERLSPNIIIPMHYKTSVCTIDLEPVDFFLDAVGGGYDVSRLGKNTFEIDKGSLKKRTRIVVMEHM